MINNMEPNNTNNSDDSLRSRVLDNLEEKKINPLPKTLFVLRECLFWFLCLITSAIGAVAVAVTLFVISYQQYAVYELTHDTFISFLLEVMPYLWFLLLFLMVLVLVFNFQHTKKGYRYSFVLVFGGGLLVSLLGGVTLYALGVGFSLDKWFGNSIAPYQSQEKFEKKIWQEPEDGRLVGVALGEVPDLVKVLRFRDVNDQNWQLTAVELSEEDWQELKLKKLVRVTGLPIVGTDKDAVAHFHACHVLPWFYDNKHDRSELRKYRKIISEEIAEFKHEIVPETPHYGYADMDLRKIQKPIGLCDKVPPLGGSLLEISR